MYICSDCHDVMTNNDRYFNRFFLMCTYFLYKSKIPQILCYGSICIGCAKTLFVPSGNPIHINLRSR